VNGTGIFVFKNKIIKHGGTESNEGHREVINIELVKLHLVLKNIVIHLIYNVLHNDICASVVKNKRPIQPD
jgi:hypothetical protein